MPLPFRPIARPVAALAIAALVLGLAVAALRSTPAAHAATSSCADSITNAPTGPATVSATSTKYGKVLVVGSGAYAGCSLYLLTSDQLHAINGAAFRVQRRAESDPAALRHVPVAGAPDERCADRGAGGQPDLARDRDQERPARARLGPAGDLRRDAALPVLPRRGAGGDRRREPVRPGHEPDRNLVPGRSEPRPARDRYGPDRRRDRPGRAVGSNATVVGRAG